MLNYHPSVDLLIDYSAGTLDLAHAFCVATHLENCVECQKLVTKLEQIGSSLFENQTHLVDKSTSLQTLKNRCFERLEEESVPIIPSKKHVNKVDKNAYKVPVCLQQFVPNTYDDLNWIGLSSSFRFAVLDKDTSGRQVALTRICAGSSIPAHSHTGEEVTLVLEGSFSDENDIYQKGDFIVKNHNHTHKPIISKDAECICLVVLDSSIQFTGFFARWFNPLLRKLHPRAI